MDNPFYNPTMMKRPTKTYVGTILTGLVDHERQIKNIHQWVGSAGMIRVHSHKREQENGGLRFIKPGRQHPTLKELVGDFLMQIPGNDTVAIASPDVLIAKDLSGLFAIANGLSVETWGAFFYKKTADGKLVPDVAPSVFVMTTSILPYLFNEIPDTLNFSTDTWARWLHEWLMVHVLKPRYFDATNTGLVTECPINAYEVKPEPEPQPAKETPAVPKETPKKAKSKQLK